MLCEVNAIMSSFYSEGAQGGERLSDRLRGTQLVNRVRITSTASEVIGQLGTVDSLYSILDSKGSSPLWPLNWRKGWMGEVA